MFSQQLMQQVVNYLVTKPYNEVANLLGVIAQEDEANKKAAGSVAATTELSAQDAKAMGETPKAE